MRVLHEIGVPSASLRTMFCSRQRATERGYRDQIATACFSHAMTNGDVSLVLYDVTRLYLEAEKEDELRKVGYSQERRVDPRVVVGPLVDRHGFPLEIGCLEGTKAETSTIIPIVKQFAERHGIAVKTSDSKRRAVPVWDPAVPVKSWRTVWTYSRKQAVRDNTTLTLQEKKARAVVAAEKAARTPRFVKTRNGANELDEASLDRARELVGLKGYVTNIEAGGAICTPASRRASQIGSTPSSLPSTTRSR